MNRQMLPIEVIGMKSDLLRHVDALRALGCVHIDSINEMPDVTARPLTPDPVVFRRQEDLGVLSARTDGVIQILGCHIKKQALQVERPPGRNLNDLREGLNALLPDVQSLTKKRDELESEMASLPLYESTLRKLLPLLPAAAHAPDTSVVGMLVNRANIAILEMVGKQALELTHGAANIVSGEVDETTVAMLIVLPKKYEKAMEGILGQSDVSRLRLPIGLEGGLPDAVLGIIHRRIREIPGELDKIEVKLEVLAQAWCGRLAGWKAILDEDMEGYQVLSKFGETDTTFVLIGWVPQDDFTAVEARLEEVGQGFVMVRRLPINNTLQERAPVILENPRPVRPFESLVRMLELPRYNHLDPTILMSIFMPIFFGLMLGDIGYGAILLVASLIMVRRFSKGLLRDLIIIIALGSAWSIFFGILFGEAFGTLGESWGLHPLWIGREKPEDVVSYLILCVAIGAGHVTLGLLLGLWEAFRNRSRSHLLERGGMLIGLMSTFFLVGVLVDFLPHGFMTPAVAGIIIGVVLLSASFGTIGIAIGWIEFIGLIGNVLSYLRLAAIGLASVYLAKVANEIAGMVGSVVVGLIVALLIHAFNLVLGAFSPTIHSLRLHYVEFFRKFYEGGGRPYEPFRGHT